MQVILKKDVQNIGEVGDLVNVKDGYARNYLLPNSMVEVATKGALENRERNIERIKAKAEKLLKSKKKDLIAVAEALLKYETLDKEQVEKIIKGEKIEDKTNDANDQKLSILNLTNNTEKQEETDDFVYDKEEKVEKIEKKKTKKSTTSTKTTKTKKKKAE